MIRWQFEKGNFGGTMERGVEGDGAGDSNMRPPASACGTLTGPC